MLWKQTLTQFCNEIKGGFFCGRHQMCFSCSWCRIITPLFLAFFRFIFIAVLNASDTLVLSMFYLWGLTFLPAGVVLTFLWMLLGILQSPLGSITCAPLFKSVPSRLTRHLLIRVPPRAPPLAALKLRRRVPLEGFFSPQQQESLSTLRQFSIFIFPAAPHRRLLTPRTGRWRGGGYFFQHRCRMYCGGCIWVFAMSAILRLLK